MDKEGITSLYEAKLGRSLNPSEEALIQNLTVRQVVRIWELIQADDDWVAALRGLGRPESQQQKQQQSPPSRDNNSAVSPDDTAINDNKDFVEELVDTKIVDHDRRGGGPGLHLEDAPPLDPSLSPPAPAPTSLSTGDTPTCISSSSALNTFPDGTPVDPDTALHSSGSPPPASQPPVVSPHVDDAPSPGEEWEIDEAELAAQVEAELRAEFEATEEHQDASDLLDAEALAELEAEVEAEMMIDGNPVVVDKDDDVSHHHDDDDHEVEKEELHDEPKNNKITPHDTTPEPEPDDEIHHQQLDTTPYPDPTPASEPNTQDPSLPDEEPTPKPTTTPVVDAPLDFGPPPQETRGPAALPTDGGGGVPTGSGEPVYHFLPVSVRPCGISTSLDDVALIITLQTDWVEYCSVCTPFVEYDEVLHRPPDTTIIRPPGLLHTDACGTPTSCSCPRLHEIVAIRTLRDFNVLREMLTTFCSGMLLPSPQGCGLSRFLTSTGTYTEGVGDRQGLVALLLQWLETPEFVAVSQCHLVSRFFRAPTVDAWRRETGGYKALRQATDGRKPLLARNVMFQVRRTVFQDTQQCSDVDVRNLLARCTSLESELKQWMEFVDRWRGFLPPPRNHEPLEEPSLADPTIIAILRCAHLSEESMHSTRHNNALLRRLRKSVVNGLALCGAARDTCGDLDRLADDYHQAMGSEAAYVTELAERRRQGITALRWFLVRWSKTWRTLMAEAYGAFTELAHHLAATAVDWPQHLWPALDAIESP